MRPGVNPSRPAPGCLLRTTKAKPPRSTPWALHRYPDSAWPHMVLTATSGLLIRSVVPAQVCLLTIRSWGQSSRTGTQNPKMLLVRAVHRRHLRKPVLCLAPHLGQAHRHRAPRRPAETMPGQAPCRQGAPLLPSLGDKAASDGGGGGRGQWLQRAHRPSHLTSCTSQRDTRLLMGKEEQAGRCGRLPLPEQWPLHIPGI